MDYEEVARRQEQTYQPDPSGTRLIPVEVGEEHQQDKKPVLKKVKDKMKKIKDTLHIKKHGHDDEHDGDEDQDTSDEEKEEGYEEDEEENIQDPEVHGAPMYDTPAAREFIAGEEIKETPEKVKLGSIDPTFQEDPAAPWTETHDASDQNRATQPPPTRGGEEIETSPVIQSFEAMTISDQPHVQKEEVKESTPPTGTHDQFSQAAARAAEEDKPQCTEETKGPSYTEKLSATAAAAKSAAVSAAAGSTDYGKKFASTVYEKVAETGTAVKEKVQQKPSATTRTVGGDATATQDKRKVVSVRDFLVEKLRPGEEDKALSEVISEAFQKRKEEAEAPEVTESGARGGGARVVEKIRGAVSSLVGGGGASRASPVSESTQTKGEKQQKETGQEPEGQKQEEQDPK